MNRKGMSQTLALIVAASVLMMTAMSVIFLATGTFEDMFGGGGQTEDLTCSRAIDFRVRNADPNSEVRIPTSCNSQNIPETYSGCLGTGVIPINEDGNPVCNK